MPCCLNRPVIDKKKEVGEEQPGLHALLIGLSKYQYLSTGNEPFGFQKVEGPAASALALAHWLEKADAAGILKRKLKTLRLLWAPSDAEKAPKSPLAALAGTYVDAQEVVTTITEWRNDCMNHPDNVALFYFAGHGVNAGPDDVYLAMGDVGHQGDSYDSICRCVPVQSVFMAMAPSGRQSNMALHQFYFIDACRVFANSIENKDADPKIGGNKLNWDDADAERAAPIYFAANSGDPAFTPDATGTEFGKALLRVLNNSSADGRDDDERGFIYPINTDSLRLAINNAMGTELPPKGHFKNAELVLRKNPPQIDIQGRVLPRNKAHHVSVDIYQEERKSAIWTINSVEPDGSALTSSVGRHRLEARWIDPVTPVGELRTVKYRTLVGPIETWEVKIIVRNADADHDQRDTAR